MPNYDDIEAIARIQGTELFLQNQFEKWQGEVLKNFYLLSGNLFSEADLRKLRNEKRPHFRTNLFLPVLLQIMGNFKASVPGLEFQGKTITDHAQARLWDSLVQYVLYQANDITYELPMAYAYSLIGRIGWIKTEWGYSKDPEGMVEVSYYDPFRLKFDIHSNRRDLSDCQYIYDSGWYSPEEISQIYARGNRALEGEIDNRAMVIMGESTAKKNMLVTWAERLMNFTFQYLGDTKGYDLNTSNLRYNKDGQFYSNGRFRVIDAYERREERRMFLFDRVQQQETDITDAVKNENGSGGKDWYDIQKVQDIKAGYIDPLISESRSSSIYQTSVVPGLNLKLFDEKQKWQNGNFKFTPVYCYNFHPDPLETKSLIDSLTDPVRSYNLRRNTMLTYLMKMAHGGWIGERGAVTDTKDDFTDGEIGGFKTVENGALSGNRIREIEAPPFPSALDRFAQEDAENVKLISGSSDNARGMQESSSESGYLFKQRVAQSNTMQEYVNDNAQATLVQVAKNIMSIVQRFMKAERVIRIDGDSTPQWIEINKQTVEGVINDVTVGRYDVLISKTPYGKEAKEQEFGKLVQLNQMLAQINPAYIDPELLVETADISVSDRMIERIKMINQQQQLQQAQMEQQQAMLQQQAQQQQPEQGAKNTTPVDIPNSLIQGVKQIIEGE